MANTRFLDAQKARFEKSKEPVLKKKQKAIEKFKKLAQDFNAEIKYYDAQLNAIDNAIASLAFDDTVPETELQSIPPAPTFTVRNEGTVPAEQPSEIEMSANSNEEFVVSE